MGTIYKHSKLDAGSEKVESGLATTSMLEIKNVSIWVISLSDEATGS